VVAAYDFGGIGRLVDVGGGHGILLRAILRSAPDLYGVPVDQPAIVEEARHRLVAEGVADRCRLVPGDFFTAAEFRRLWPAPASRSAAWSPPVPRPASA
jgi:hypothetical protein